MAFAYFQVERTYVNYVTGETRRETLPKKYRTYLGASRCAQRNSWTTAPDHNTRIDSMTARVIEVSK